MDKVMLLGLAVVIIPPLPPNITKTEPATAKACSSTKGLFTALYMESGSSRPVSARPGQHSLVYILYAFKFVDVYTDTE